MRGPRAAAIGALAMLAVLLLGAGPLTAAVQAQQVTAQILPQTAGPCPTFSFFPWAMFGPCGLGAYPAPGAYSSLWPFLGFGPVSAVGGPSGLGPSAGFGTPMGCPGCPGSSPFPAMGMPGAAMPGAPSATAPAGANQVTIVDFAFQPAEITVPVGTQVAWTNSASRQHTVTDPGVWDSGPLNSGQRYAAVFAVAGTFDYHCMIHPEMHGRVTVTAQ